MPVRSLTSSIMKWPSRREVHAAIDQWVQQVASVTTLPVIIIKESSLPFESRSNI